MMSVYAIAERLRLTFTLRLESEHFVFVAADRNPRRGRGMGTGGVRDGKLLTCYRDGMERLYCTMTHPPFERTGPLGPLVGPEGKTVVCVFNITERFHGNPSASTDVDWTDVPYVCLPCRGNEPTWDAELQRGAAQAVHEGVHVFNFRERPPRDLNSAPWGWFDEAMAVLMETLLLPDNPDTLRFGLDWSDKPETPLDQWTAKYQAGFFLRYLAKRMGLAFINTVWTDSEDREAPLDAIARLLPAPQQFSSPDPNVRDLFASGYCMDSYFLWDPKSLGFAPEVYARFGHRALTESYELHTGDKPVAKGSLDHLACRYYRFYIHESVRSLRLELKTPERSGDTPLKAEVAIVTKEKGRGSVKALKRVPGMPGQAPLRLCAELTQLTPEDIDHLVLVVTNCGTRPAQTRRDVPHDDGQEYEIEATAL